MLIRIIAFAVITFLVTSCNTGPEKIANINKFGGHLRFSDPSNSTIVFPHSIVNVASSRLADQLHDGLVMLNETETEVKPCIAKSWKVSEDGTEYVFSLKTNVFFHDNECFEGGEGRAVTAADFVYSFSLLSTPDENNKNFSPFVDMIDGGSQFYEKGGIKTKDNVLKGVTAVNDSTLIIKLNKASGTFIYLLATTSMSVVPKEGFDKFGYRSVVGAGPFSLASIDEDSMKLVFKRNPYYFMADNQGNILPYVDSVTIFQATSLRKALVMLKKGEIDFIQNVPSSDVAFFLEENINMFQPPKPRYILQVSAVMKEWQDVVSTKLKNYRSNSINTLDLSVMQLDN